ncbi:MAG: undecaprenyl-diphosphate phosphatase [Eubacteriales bacterium]|nr:undecaprenyl-diphosphate phosphatase [Eubacteriales bacterium]
MNFFHAILLGLLQGITEFLPVSSSGHIAILENIFDFGNADNLFFEVFLHIGTLFAVAAVLRKDLLRLFVETLCMLRDLFENLKLRIHNSRTKDAKRRKKIVHNQYRKMAVLLLISAIPTGIIGIAASELAVLAKLTLLTPGICLIFNGMLLLVADASETSDKKPLDVSNTNGFLLGIAQGLSILPGLSRSGITITGGILCGFDCRLAVRFSYLMSVPAILGALIVELTKVSWSSVTVSSVFVCIFGAVAAGVSGFFCIRKLLGIVRKKQFKWFAFYCILIGVLSIAGYFITR